jgi:sterol desaturase/sphingolipid hydroxylase (fatty acid hydroxylase superfamily)
MGKIKRLSWMLGLLGVCAVMVLAAGHDQLQRFAGTHRGSAHYLWLALLLAVPAGLATLAAACLLELLLVGWPRSSLRLLLQGSPSVKLDVLSMAMTLLPQGLLAYALSLGLQYVIEADFQRLRGLSLTPYLPTWGLQVACLVLFRSFVSYWVHRLEHTIPALWALHKFHHSADRLAIVTSERRTQLAKGVEEFLLFLLLVVLSNPTAAKPAVGSAAYLLVAGYFAFGAFVSINSYLVHSNLTTGYGWIGRWLLVSPRMHRLHHAMSPAYYNKNFTFDFVFWDRLFGTYASCDAQVAASIPLGLADNPFSSGGTVSGPLRDYFLTPYLVLWQELRRGLKAWQPMPLQGPRSAAQVRVGL